MLALDYLAALAITWLHITRNGAPTTPVFPGLPDMREWPEPSVPLDVLEQNPDVRRALLGARPVPGSGDAVEVFGDNVELLKPKSTDPALPGIPVKLAFTWRYEVRERDQDIDCGVTLEFGDAIEVAAIGEVFSGELLS